MSQGQLQVTDRPVVLAAHRAKGSDIYEMGAHLQGIQAVCQRHGPALLIVHQWNLTGSGKGAKRISGAGPETWGPFLVSADVISRSTNPVTKASDVVFVLDFQGDEIAETAVRIRRRVWVDDPEDLASPMHCEVTRIETPEPRRARASGHSPIGSAGARCTLRTRTQSDRYGRARHRAPPAPGNANMRTRPGGVRCFVRPHRYLGRDILWPHFPFIALVGRIGMTTGNHSPKELSFVGWLRQLFVGGRAAFPGWWWLLPAAWVLGPSRLPPRNGIRRIQHVEIRVKMRDGTIAHSRVNELFGLLEIWALGVYSVPGLDWSDMQSVVDVGANVGFATLYFAARAPSAHIVAIEPALDSVRRMERNLRENGISDRVTVIQAAVGAHAGLAYTERGDNSRLTRVYVEPTKTGARTDVIDFSTVVGLANDSIDLLKLDCEGGEYALLDGATAEDLARVSAVVGEYHPAENSVQSSFFAKLREGGLHEVHSPPNRHLGEAGDFSAIRDPRLRR